MECNGIGRQPPVTLAVFTFLEGANQHDFYDLSNVDGYNSPMKIRPLGGRKAAGAPLDQFNCGAPKCNMYLNKCPPELKMNKTGTIVCASICAAVNNAKQRSKFPAPKAIFNNPKERALVCCECLCPPNSGECNCKNAKSKYCCSPYNKPSALENGEKCAVEEWPLASTKGRSDAVFKNACPDAYSWQFDDHKSTYVCEKANYRVTFC